MEFCLVGIDVGLLVDMPYMIEGISPYINFINAIRKRFELQETMEGVRTFESEIKKKTQQISK